jgi:tetratricopeptide (TPR) repeat protein
MQDGQMEKALDAFEFALACNPKKQDEINIIKGYCHFLNDDYEEGARLYEEAAKASGYKNKQVDIFLGECYVYMQRYEDGYRTMTRYLENFGEFEDPEMYLYYFFCCEEVGKIQRGLDYLYLGLEKFPYNVQLNTALILYCKKNGMEEEASERISNLYKIMKNPPKKSKGMINDLMDSDIVRFDEDGLRMFFKRVGEIVNMDHNMSVTDLSMGLFHFNKKGFKKPDFLTPEALGMSPDEVWEKNFVKNTMKDTPEARLTVVLAYKYMYNPDHYN